MATPATLPELLRHLTEGRTLILPNPRAARNLRRAYDDLQRTNGLAAWQPARALAWNQWTTSLYSSLILDGAESRLLLNQAQEYALWREVVASPTLASPDALADLARSAFHLAAQYNATSRLRQTASTHDAKTFAAWAEAFLKLCAKSDALSPALLEQALIQHLQRNTLAHPAELLLTGFGPLTPAQAALTEALSLRHTTITHLDPRSHLDTQAAKLEVPAEADELTAATQYLRDLFSASPPPVSVAVILPATGAETRAQLESTFRNILTPELQSIHADLSSTPWESAGQPLSSVALVSTAVNLAHWAIGTLATDRISALLLSPYLGTADDRELSPRFDAQVLRRARLLRPEADLRSLLTLAASQTERALAPSWLQPLQQAIAKAGDLTKPRTHADWTEFLRTLTHAANWPGPRALNATEFEATRAWDSALDLLSTLDFTGRRVPLAEALQTLDHQAAQTAFSPPSTGAIIQVLTPEEANGSLFDATLFLRATDANWPRPQRPNPLLSWSLQHELQMPGTDPALDTTRARQLTQSLLQRSTTTLFTHASETPKGANRLSPLVAELDLPSLTQEFDLFQLEAGGSPEITLDAVPDSHPIPALPSANVEGGTRVLKLQAACGFLAFAELRLHSTATEDHTLGLDALESGNILHRTLEKFWKRVESRAELAKLSREDREQILRPCIDASISSKLRVETDWDRAYLAVQKERLLTVLQNWLDEELDRGPFTVLSSEREELITVGPLTFTVRIDRVDQVEGGHFFVDYKTGYAADPRQWEGDRPEEPQLPLYSLFSQPGELKGMAFARVRAGNGVEWRGYQAEPGLLPSRKITDLDTAIENWRSTLAVIAGNFASGVADVNPKDVAINCARCAQRLLCRINPEAFLASADANSEEAE